MADPPDLDTTDHRERDAASIRILGIFFSVLGALVLVGTLASLESAHAAIINAVSGLVLLGIGIAMVLCARRGKKSKP